MAKEIRNRWAFLVGVNNYRESSRFQPLSHCVADVLALKKLLETIGFGTAICLHDDLIREDERFPDNANTVKAELRKLRDKIGPDDLLLVYFACHGTRSLSADDTRPYLILRDTRTTLPETALSVADLKAEMQHIKAERQVLILDACHMGLGKEDRGDETVEARQFIQNVHELATGFALLTPSTAKQTTKESAVLQHGVFSNFVLAGLRGEGSALVSTKKERRFVTVGSLSQYVADQMINWAADKGYEQMPQGNREGGLGGDFIVVDYRGEHSLPELSVSGQMGIAELEVSRSTETDLVEGAAANKNDKRSTVINWDNGQSRKLLREAMLSVYLDRTDLDQFLDEELNEKLNEVALTGNLKNDVFTLIKTANAKGWIAALYDTFCRCNANNPTVLVLQQQLSSLD